MSIIVVPTHSQRSLIWSRTQPPPILDAFNRADEPILGNGTWTTPSQSGTNQINLTANQISSSLGASDAYWSLASFSTTPGVEAYMDFVTVNGTDRFLLQHCLQNPNSGAENFYDLQINRATNLWRLNRIDAAVSILLHDHTQAIANGDGGGIRNIQGLIEVWWRTAGVWSLLFTFTDTTYTSGFIGVGMIGTVNRADNFGGGIFIPPDPSPFACGTGV